MTWLRWLAAAVRPPPFPEPYDAGKQRLVCVYGLVVGAVAWLVDLLIWVALEGDPALRREVVVRFSVINLPTMTILLVLSAIHVRRPPSRRFAAAAIVLTALATISWVQVTGSISSYFLAAGFLLVAAQRLLLDWHLGLVGTLAMAAFHVGIFAAEEAGWLMRAPLFTRGPGAEYDSVAYRWTAMTSIISVYFMNWVGANLIMRVIRRKEAALADAERRLAEAAAGAQHGRLTGAAIAGGAFSLRELLGRGGMAEVYRAHRDSDGLSCALKVMHPHIVSDATMMARFRREAEIAALFPREVTPLLHEVRLAGPGERFLVLEHLTGEDLGAHLRRRGRLPALEAVVLVERIARILDIVHDGGVVHRDLKPQNVFLVTGGEPALAPRLLDFGVARRIGDDSMLTQSVAVLGTPGFIAPEAVTGRDHPPGPEADVFALGVIAYALLTGERPFTGRDAAEMLDQVLHRDPTPASRLCPALVAGIDEVLALALAKDPKMRYQRASAFSADLRAACEGRLASDVTRRGRALLSPQLDDTHPAVETPPG